MSSLESSRFESNHVIINLSLAEDGNETPLDVVVSSVIVETNVIMDENCCFDYLYVGFFSRTRGRIQ
jgi:hypothetical protein